MCNKKSSCKSLAAFFASFRVFIESVLLFWAEFFCYSQFFIRNEIYI